MTYNEAFADSAEVEPPIELLGRGHVYHLYVIRLNLERLRIDRKQFVEELRLRNIGVSVHFIPVHLHPFYRERFGYGCGDLRHSEALYDRIVSLPIYPRMTECDVQDVIAAVSDVACTFKR